MRCNSFASRYNSRACSASCGSDATIHAQKILGLLGFLDACPNTASKVFLRHAFVRFAVIGTNRRATADKLRNEPVIRGMPRNLLRESNNGLTKRRRPLLKIKCMPGFGPAVRFVLEHQRLETRQRMPAIHQRHRLVLGA